MNEKISFPLRDCYQLISCVFIFHQQNTSIFILSEFFFFFCVFYFLSFLCVCKSGFLPCRVWRNEASKKTNKTLLHQSKLSCLFMMFHEILIFNFLCWEWSCWDVKLVSHWVRHASRSRQSLIHSRCLSHVAFLRGSISNATSVTQASMYAKHFKRWVSNPSGHCNERFVWDSNRRTTNPPANPRSGVWGKTLVTARVGPSWGFDWRGRGRQLFS